MVCKIVCLAALSCLLVRCARVQSVRINTGVKKSVASKSDNTSLVESEATDLWKALGMGSPLFLYSHALRYRPKPHSALEDYVDGYDFRTMKVTATREERTMRSTKYTVEIAFGPEWMGKMSVQREFSKKDIDKATGRFIFGFGPSSRCGKQQYYVPEPGLASVIGFLKAGFSIVGTLKEETLENMQLHVHPGCPSPDEKIMMTFGPFPKEVADQLTCANVKCTQWMGSHHVVEPYASPEITYPDPAFPGSPKIDIDPCCCFPQMHNCPKEFLATLTDFD